MANYFQILCIADNSTIDVARASYRKLAMQHHPDRGGSEAQFKLIKEAWEAIENGYRVSLKPVQTNFNNVPGAAGFKRYSKPEDPIGAWVKNVYTAPSKPTPPKSVYKPSPIKAYRPPRVNKGDFEAFVSMDEAINGFICEIEIDNKVHRIQVPKGAPDGLRFSAPIKDLEDVTIIVKMKQNAYSFVSLNEAEVDKIMVDNEIHIVHRTADLKITLELSKQECRRSQTLTDPFGKEFTVKMPEFYQNGKPEVIKIEKRGYVDWCSSKKQCGDNRGNIYVTIVPLEKIDFKGKMK